jgi:ubiquinone/menaquinone biosynthesis C-methylase UbiE
MKNKHETPKNYWLRHFHGMLEMGTKKIAARTYLTPSEMILGDSENMPFERQLF